MRRLVLILFFVSGCVIGMLWARSLQDSSKPIYGVLKKLPYAPDGWFRNGPQIAHLIKTHQVKTVAEVGSWMGRSSILIASMLPSDGFICCIDHFLGSVEHQPGQVCHDQRLPYLYHQFLSNVMQSGLKNKIIPLRMASVEAAKAINFQPDLIYIDASHETKDVYEDLCTWFPIAGDKGLLCGDDWDMPSVRAAVEQFAKEKHLTVVGQTSFWYFKR